MDVCLVQAAACAMQIESNEKLQWCQIMRLMRPCAERLTGVTGVGKSVMLADALNKAAERGTVLPHTLNFSAQTSSLETQMLMESKLEKKRKTRCVGRAGGCLLLT
jgi:hypothetical protein